MQEEFAPIGDLRQARWHGQVKKVRGSYCFLSLLDKGSLQFVSSWLHIVLEEYSWIGVRFVGVVR